MNSALSKKTLEPRDPNATSYLSSEMVLEGLLHSKTPIVIQGTFMGDIECDQTVFVTDSGTVIGNITSRYAKIEGKVKGNLTILEKLSFDGMGSLEGEILTASLEVTSNSSIEGNCRMMATSIIEKMLKEQGKKLEEKIQDK